MRPSLSAGTILQNRYRVLSVLGQGGFGRTYLAEDQGRFNERCALKELTPAQGSDYALDKSKELFQREAQTLYQIQHPQIPQFRATFEQDQRLFLVQDFVEGQTYRALLDQRRVQGFAFSEEEVIQLMRQVLPVLAHIHSKGIIHRDIAPDNIMLRQNDGKPVLIDFGVVKELATRFQAMGTMVQATTVGKPGYAPPEQMQTGRAYPSSDLYSLAVMAIVLLTGREPQELYDDSTMNWFWQRWVTVSPGFAEVLNRMLNYRPGDRYQNVSEVVQALQAVTPGAVSPPAPYPPAIPPSQPVPQPVVTPPTPAAPLPVAPPPNTADVRTVAVGGRANPPVAPGSTQPVGSPAQPPRRGSIWDDPWAVGLVGTGLVVMAGVGSWALVRSLLGETTPPNPIVSPSPSPTASPTISPSPSPKPPSPKPPSPRPEEPVNYSQRLNLAAGQSLSRSGTLKSNETLDYLFTADQEDRIIATISGEGVLMTVLAPNGTPVNERAQRVSYWEGALPYNGQYTVQLRPIKGLPRTNYNFDITRTAAAPTPTPTPPTPEPTPTIDQEVISFPPGRFTTRVSGQVGGDRTKRYLLYAEAGQVLTAEIIQGGATMDVRYPDGTPLENATGVSYSQSTIPANGEYLIDVSAPSSTAFSMRVRLRRQGEQDDS
jgi:serine/threonine-protein kinase